MKFVEETQCKICHTLVFFSLTDNSTLRRQKPT